MLMIDPSHFQKKRRQKKMSNSCPDFVFIDPQPVCGLPQLPTSLNQGILERSTITQAQADPRLYVSSLNSLAQTYAFWLRDFRNGVRCIPTPQCCTPSNPCNKVLCTLCITKCYAVRPCGKPTCTFCINKCFPDQPCRRSACNICAVNKCSPQNPCGRQTCTVCVVTTCSFEKPCYKRTCLGCTKRFA